MSETIRGVCPHDCPDRCVWKVTVENGRAVKLVGDSEHEFTGGVLCAKVSHYLDRVYSPERVLYPMKRVGAKGEGHFKRVTWDEALEDVSERLDGIIDEFGPTSVLPYSFAGTQGIVQQNAGNRFFAKIGASQLDRTICSATGRTGVHATIGTDTGVLPEDIVHSRFIILWGTNTLVTNLHLWPYIQKARSAGAKVVVIDPIKTRTAERADWHIRPRPGTDAALALGMMNVIVQEGLEDAEYVDKHTVGFQELKGRLAEYSPERASEITGVDADEIRQLARAYATASPSTIRLLVGMEHHSNGGMTYRTISCLPALVGAWKHLGGGLLFMTSMFYHALNMDPTFLPELPPLNTRRINMVQLGQALTDSDMSPPIKAMFVYNSNPATIAPNQKLVVKGLERDDLFTVVMEQFVTDTARYADYVFPATTELENLDVFSSWGHTYVTLNRPAIEPVGEAATNTEFFRRLARKMGFGERYLYDSDKELVRMALASGHALMDCITFEHLMEKGYAKLKIPKGYMPFAEGNFPTSSGKCEFYSKGMLSRGLDPLPAYVPPRESRFGSPELASRYPMNLISSKSALHFMNSSYANLPRHRKAEGEPYLEMNVNDAELRGIQEQDWVKVFNDRGEVRLRVKVGDRVPKDVVAAPTGWWASLSHEQKSINVLTSDGLSDMGRGGDFYDTLVEVSKV